ncbi:LuxR C-terminal-related transcriptional regulator [Diaphorobacter caeni]|uniref:LuxR C-terminal-related transcriptional regulator n=1 Tax=Diaphorobacter caeni TaxID=2784387 RepID=UPI00188E4118|nr:response regulator transcription factor [Diaphorobacter caeni]MBF5003455.1 response regulator transcription factor [Diaphorobacter caeni]
MPEDPAAAHPSQPPSGFAAPRIDPGSTLPTPVLVVEDEPEFQQRLREVLLQLGYAPDALIFAATLGEARAMLASQPVAMALVDLALPDGNGRELITELRTQDPWLGILVVTAWSSEDDILGALRAGATGYVLKERDDFEVMLSIRSALRGGAPIDPFIARRILELLPDAPAVPPPPGASTLVEVAFAPQADPKPEETPSGEYLSKREREILKMVANGLSNREISEHLHLSYYTVETHVKRIYRKLCVNSRAMAVRAALERGDLLG